MDVQKREWLNGHRIRTQAFSPWTMDMLEFVDVGSRAMMDDYLKYHQMEAGWNISAHSLELCGLKDLATDAWQASQGRFAYGAIFAIANHRLKLLPKAVLPQMIELASQYYVHGYLFERLWLHFFGLKFQSADHARLLSEAPRHYGRNTNKTRL